MKYAFLAAIAIAAAATTGAQAEAILIDYDQSTLGFKVKSGDRVISGTFNNWTAEIEFDKEAIETASFVATVHTGDVTVSDPIIASILPSTDWLNSNVFPTAQFESETVRDLGDNTYLVSGVLSLVGQQSPVDLVVKTSDGDGALIADVSGKMDRTDFGVGARFGSEIVAAQIKLTAHVVQSQ